MLPDDVARCGGRWHDTRATVPGDRLFACCEECARRLSPPSGERQPWTVPPEFGKGKCPIRMEKEWR
jgi:hypothetical protein